MLGIRLVITACDGNSRQVYYCQDAFNIDQRLKILQTAFNTPFHFSGINDFLVVTNHNFFWFSIPACINISNNNVLVNFIPSLFNFLISNNNLTNIKHLVIGFDVEGPNASNPHGGIDAIVAYLIPNGNSYQLGTYVWECWTQCSPACFTQQNRTFTFNSGGRQYTIGLLSCGDILSNCLHNVNGIPSANIYLDLAHMSIKGFNRFNDGAKFLLCCGRAQCVFITHQVTQQKIREYSQKGYPHIYVNGNIRGIHIQTFNNNNVAFIDIVVP